METEPHYFDDGVMGCEAGNKETAASRPAATVSKFSHAMIVRQARGMGSNYADVESEILLVVKSIHGRRIEWEPCTPPAVALFKTYDAAQV